MHHTHKPKPTTPPRDTADPRQQSDELGKLGSQASDPMRQAERAAHIRSESGKSAGPGRQRGRG